MQNPHASQSQCPQCTEAEETAHQSRQRGCCCAAHGTTPLAPSQDFERACTRSSSMCSSSSSSTMLFGNTAEWAVIRVNPSVAPTSGRDRAKSVAPNVQRVARDREYRNNLSRISFDARRAHGHRPRSDSEIALSHACCKRSSCPLVQRVYRSPRPFHTISALPVPAGAAARHAALLCVSSISAPALSPPDHRASRPRALCATGLLLTCPLDERHAW